nr:TRAP transporter substrate-binding protein [uncultured Halomonas sp.]
MGAIKKLIFSAALGGAILASAAAQAEKLRLGHVTPPSHIWHKVAQRFDANLQTATDGEDWMMLFPLGRLGGPDQMIDLLQTGGIQLAMLTASSIANRYAPMNAWFLPYTFDNVSEAAAATQSPEAQQMLKDLKEHKLVGLGYVLAGMRHVLSVDPLTNLESFENQKIRAFPNPVFNDWWSELGAAPTALALSDVSSALTTNLLDGVDVDLDIVVGLKMYQQAPYLTLTNHMAFPAVVVASEKWWSGLSDEKRQTVMDAFKEAEAWGFEQQAKAEVSNLQMLKESGVTVNEIDQTSLQQAADKIIEKYTSFNDAIADFYQAQTK